MLKELHENLLFHEISLLNTYHITQIVVTLPTEYVHTKRISFIIMQEETTNISAVSAQRMMRHRFRDGLTLLAEALIWTGCVYATSLLQGIKAGTVTSFIWFVLLGWGLAFLLVATCFIPNNAYSRTARRDEVVACAMKTGLAFAVLTFAAFSERTSVQFFACILFCMVLTLERLILNSIFIRYSMRHCEHGVILCNEETSWQQQALQQNTYGLKLDCLETQAAQQLAEYLAAHPETESIYCATSSLSAAELEDVAHICCKQGVTLHLLPLAPCSMPQTMQSDCRGTINVLSPAKLPLQSIFGRIIKRLTDIVLSFIVLFTIFPVFSFVAFICIKRQSRGPILVTRHMCGMNGKVFQSITFRTRHYEAAPSFLEGINDPGYFPFGKFLKHSKLELLPQFICVLWGSMTIVGSQTIRPERYADYHRELRQLFASNCRLKAGITNYRFTTQATSGILADVWYCRNWGFWLDLRIMLHRIGTLLSNSKSKSIKYI